MPDDAPEIQLKPPSQRNAGRGRLRPIVSVFVGLLVVARIRLVDQGNIVHASDATGLVVITTLQPIAVVLTLPQQTLPAVTAAMRAGQPEAVALAQSAAGIGALLALLLCGLDLSLVALIGIVLLMGIVKKNAIMMVDFATEAERTHGMSPEVAIREACLLRFRPITMTTAAALLGALPLVLDHGSGSELRYPLGVTIIGGLLLSQFLTLYTTPSIYLAMERLRLAVAGPRATPRPAE